MPVLKLTPQFSGVLPYTARPARPALSSATLKFPASISPSVPPAQAKGSITSAGRTTTRLAIPTLGRTIDIDLADARKAAKTVDGRNSSWCQPASRCPSAERGADICRILRAIISRTPSPEAQLGRDEEHVSAEIK